MLMAPAHAHPFLQGHCGRCSVTHKRLADVLYREPRQLVLCSVHVSHKDNLKRPQELSAVACCRVCSLCCPLLHLLPVLHDRMLLCCCCLSSCLPQLLASEPLLSDSDPPSLLLQASEPVVPVWLAPN
jgi:hypothetical protein